MRRPLFTAFVATLLGVGASCVGVAMYLDSQPWPGVGRRYVTREEIRDDLQCKRATAAASRDVALGHLRLYLQSGPTGVSEWATFLHSRFGIEVVERPGCFPSTEWAAYDEAYNAVVHAELARRYGPIWHQRFEMAFERSQAPSVHADPCP